AGRGKSGAVAWDFRRRPCTGLAEFTLVGPFSFWLPHLGVRAKQKNTCIVDYLRVPTTGLRVGASATILLRSAQRSATLVAVQPCRLATSATASTSGASMLIKLQKTRFSTEYMIIEN